MWVVWDSAIEAMGEIALSRKNKSKGQRSASGEVKPPSKIQSQSSSATKASPPKTGVFAMDAFRAQDAASKEAVRRAVRTGDGYDNFISRIGLQNDNALSAGTYEFNYITKNRVLLEAAYRGSWIVGAVVDSYADDMTRAGIDITTSDKADLKILFKAMTRLQVWESLNEDIKWGRLYGGAIGVINIEGQDLSTPLDIETVGKDQFKGIIVYDRWLLNPVLQDVIESGPEMGLPKFYQIVTQKDAASPDPKLATVMQNVHHSRVIRYIGIKLPYFQAITEMMWGESVLERLWDRLIGFDNASMSAAQLIDRANLRTVSVEGLREIIAAGGEAQAGLEKMFDMMRAMQLNEGLTLIDKNDEMQTTSYSFAGLSDMLLQLGQQLSGACGIPLARLFSQNPAGLNADGDSDIRQYYDNINAMQEARLRNPLDTILKIMWRSVYGVAAPKDLEFKFTPLWQMSESDRATNAKTTTETIIGAYESGLVPQKTAMEELRDSSRDTGVFANITDADIAQAEEELPPSPEEMLQLQAEAKPDPGEEKPKEPTKDAKMEAPWKRLASWFSK